MKSLNQSVPSQSIDKFQKGDYNYPPENVPAKTKAGKDWCSAFAMAIFARYCKGNSGLPFQANGVNINDYATIRQYAVGQQPVIKYKEQIGHEENQHKPDQQDVNRFSYNKNISWANQSIIPKYRKATIANLMEMDVDLTPVGVDENSMKARTRIKNAIWERSQNKFYDRIYAALGQKDEPLPFVPADKQELELFASTSLELLHEQNMKKVVDRTFEINNWNVFVKRKIYEDLFDLGIAIVNEYMDPVTKKPKIEYIDPEYAIFQGSLDNNYADGEQFGHVVFMSVKKLRARLIGQGTYIDEQTFLNQLAPFTQSWGVNRDLFNQGNKDSHGQYPYDYRKVPVLHAEYKSYNSETVTTRTTKSGKKIEEFRPSDTSVVESENLKVEKFPYEMWYRCDWVIGTEIFFNYGPKDWVKRRYDGKTFCSYSIFNTGNNSFGNQLIPIEDDNELTLKKFQIAWLNAHPHGFAVFWSAFSQMSFDGKIDPIAAFQLFMDKGVLLVNDEVFGELGVKQIQHVIMELKGGIGESMNEYVTNYNFNIAKVNDIVGISGTIAGDSPIPGQLVQTTEIAQNQSLKAISHLAEAYNIIKKSVYQHVIWDIQQLCFLFPQGFEEIFAEFSSNTVQKIKIGADGSGSHYELRVDVDATLTEKQSIVQAAMNSAQNGSLTWPDALLIQELVRKGRSTFARIIMDYRLTVNAQREQQNQLALIQENAKTQQESVFNALNAELEKIAAEGKEDRLTQMVIGKMKEALEILKASLESKNPKPKPVVAGNKSAPKKEPV